MTKTAIVPALAVCMAVGCAGGQSSTRVTQATPGSVARHDRPIHDPLTPSEHARGVTETCRPPYVPDEATAIRIAEAVWLHFYGQGIYEQRPFRAELVEETWIVAGSLPEGSQGGVPIARISRDDGRILQVIHTQ